MSLLPFLDIGMQLINKLLPDPEQKAKAQLELMRLQQEGEFKELEAELQILTGQIEINKIEAGGDDKFTKRWRPFIGWTCGIAFSYHFILQPFLLFVFAIFGKQITPPTFDMETLYTVLMGLLGLGTLRTAEKIKGVARY